MLRSPNKREAEMKVYTTGEVSRICQVSMSTVNKWFDSGQLKGFRVPGSRHRRIPRADLVRFLQAHGMPCEDFELEEESRVMIVSRDAKLGQLLESQLTSTPHLTSLLVRSGFDAGIQAESFRPDCVIVDFGVGGEEARRICQHVRCRDELAGVVLIAVLSGAEWSGEELSLVDDAFESPFDPALLIERVRTLVATRKEAAL